MDDAGCGSFSHRAAERLFAGYRLVMRLSARERLNLHVVSDVFSYGCRLKKERR